MKLEGKNDLLGKLEEVMWMDRKRNNPTWCCDQIEEKIKDYKISLTEIKEEEVNKKLAEIVPRQQQIREELEEIIKELEVDYHE